MAGKSKDEKDTPTPDGTQPVDVMGRLLNLTPRHLQRLAVDGVIPKAARGRYELVPVVQGYVKYLQDLVARKGDNAHQTAQTTLAQERAKKAARENAVATGELIPKGDVVAGMQAMVGHSRARLLAIPAKLAPTIHLAESVPEIKEMLTEALHDALQELSDTRAVAILADPNGPGDGVGVDGSPQSVDAAAKPKRKRVGRSREGAKSGKRRGTRKVGDGKG